MENAAYISGRLASDAKQTFATTLDHAVEQASGVANRVEMLADRLCGGIPTTGAGSASGAPQAVPNGVFDSIEVSARRIMDAHIRINDALSRIESALP